MNTQVVFTKYEREICADGIISRYRGTLDGLPFCADYNSIDGLYVFPEGYHGVIQKAITKSDLNLYPNGLVDGNSITVTF